MLTSHRVLSRPPSAGSVGLVGLAGLVCTASLVLAGCGSTPADPPSTAPSTPAASAPSTASTAPASPSPTDSATGSPGASSPTASTGAGSGALLAAGATAEKKTAQKVISIESEANGTSWEVHVVGDDGSEQKLLLSADGATVTTGPTDERPDTGDQAQNRRYAAVTVDYERAVAGIAKAVTGGSITELDLDTSGSTIVWEADVTAGTQRRSVQLDASSGAVVSNTIDR